jgi:hypothetical protein
MIEKTEGVSKNGQSKDTGNIGYTKHRGGKIKKKPQKQKQNNTTQKTKNDEQQNRTDTQR